MMSMSMANLYWHAVRGQNGPEAGGLGADLRRGSSGGKNVAEASNDVRLQAHHIRFAGAVLFCSLSEFATDQIGIRVGSLNDRADIATPKARTVTLRHPWREPIDAGKSWFAERRKEPRMISDNRARLRVAALIFTMVNAVVFGVGLVTVLTTPALAQHGFFWIPVIVVSSFVISPPLSWLIAPMMMQRFIQSRQTR
jgi:hypothetical protein